MVVANSENHFGVITMHVKLYEQEYLSIKEIAKEWAKEPGNISADKIEQEIWRAYWLAKFVDENNESTFMIPYEDREYISEGELTVNIIHESEEEKYNKESIKYFAIVYKEGSGEIEPVNFWVRYLHSSPTSVSLERFYTHYPENHKSFEEKHNSEFTEQIKNLVKQYKDSGVGYLSKEDDFTQSLIREYHIINLHYKTVTRYFPLERPFLFDRLYSNNLLEFTPKLLNKSSRENESGILDSEDYKMLSEQNLIFSGEFFKSKNFFDKDSSRKKLMERYLNPVIMPSDFVGVCKKLNIDIPVFLGKINEDSAEIVKKKTRGRGKNQHHSLVMNFLSGKLAGVTCITPPNSVNKIKDDFYKKFPYIEDSISPTTVKNHINLYLELNGIANNNLSFQQSMKSKETNEINIAS